MYAHTTSPVPYSKRPNDALKFWSDCFWKGPRPTRDTNHLQVLIPRG
jgi:hypothetical protein